MLIFKIFYQQEFFNFLGHKIWPFAEKETSKKKTLFSVSDSEPTENQFPSVWRTKKIDLDNGAR